MLFACKSCEFEKTAFFTGKDLNRGHWEVHENSQDAPAACTLEEFL